MTRVLDYGDEANYAPATSSAWKVYRRLVGYALRDKFRLLIVIALSFVVAVSFTSMIIGAGAAIDLLYSTDDIAAEKTTTYAKYFESFPGDAEARFRSLVSDMRANRAYGMRVLCIALVALSAIAGIARFFQEYLAGMIGARVSIRLNEEMFANVVRQSHGFFEKKTSGEVLARFTNDAFMVNKGLANVFVKLIREPIKAVFFLGIALSVNVVLTLIVICILPPVLFTIQVIGKQVRRSARRSLQKVAAMASVINETVSGIDVIKSFRMEEYQTKRVDGELSKLRRYLIRMARADAAVGPISEFIMVLGIVALLMFSQNQLDVGTLSVGELVKLFAALAFMMDPLRKLASVNNMVQTSVASAERVFEYIDLVPDVQEATTPSDLSPLSDALRFENVEFSYRDGTQVLKGLTFTAHKGEMVALVGFSGAGKSTAAKLIPRFYDVTAGQITVDGIDIRDTSLASLRDQISVVTQQTILFHESVRGNITFGHDDFSDERIHEAARAAHADEFIEAMPQGYDEVLSESGGNLSGGQRQRLAIARAIVKDPAILILDEATSSLDSESERMIQQAIDSFVVGRTTVVIAHRLSTIQRADRIVVIDDGQAVEQGTHEELFAAGGIYRRLFDVQFGAQSEKQQTS